VARVVARVRTLQAGAGLADLKCAAGAAHAVTTQLPFRTALAARAAVGRVAFDGRARAVAVELARGTEPRAAPFIAEHAVGASRIATAAVGGVRRDGHAAIAAALLSRGAARGVHLTGVRALKGRRGRRDLARAPGDQPEHESRHEPHPNAKPTRQGPRCARQDRRRRCHGTTVPERPAASAPRVAGNAPSAAPAGARSGVTSEQCAGSATHDMSCAVRQRPARGRRP
jgi:hypothetical protein